VRCSYGKRGTKTCIAFITTRKNVDTEDEEAEQPAVQRLSQALEGVIIIQKGKSDVISDGQKGERVDLVNLLYFSMPTSTFSTTLDATK
jgi:hydroxyethylthiazole kinase-like sugar kinase family protein